MGDRGQRRLPGRDDDAGARRPGRAGRLDQWLKNPQNDLFGRCYDGLGFFAMLDQAGDRRLVADRERARPPSSGEVDRRPTPRRPPGVPDIFYSAGGPGLRDAAWDPSGTTRARASRQTTAGGAQIGGGTPATSSTIEAPSAPRRRSRSAPTCSRSAPTRTSGASCAQRQYPKLAKGAPTAPRRAAASAAPTRTCSSRRSARRSTSASATFKEGADVSIQGRQAEGLLQAPDRRARARDRAGHDGGGSCPTTPDGAAARTRTRDARRPRPGSDLLDDPESTMPVASFTIGSCTQGPGRLHRDRRGRRLARSRSGSRTSPASADYEIPYGGPGSPRW